MELNRRDFIKSNAIAATAAVAGVTVPGISNAKKSDADDGIRWDKAACRFCGTGCSVLIGVKGDRVVASQAVAGGPGPLL